MLNSTNRLLFLPLLVFLISVPALASGSPVLHGRSFKRPDPLRHFKDYNGDFDVRNKHYIAVSRFSTSTCMIIDSSVRQNYMLASSFHTVISDTM